MVFEETVLFALDKMNIITLKEYQRAIIQQLFYSTLPVYILCCVFE